MEDHLYTAMGHNRPIQIEFGTRGSLFPSFHWKSNTTDSIQKYQNCNMFHPDIFKTVALLTCFMCLILINKYVQVLKFMYQ